MSAVAWECPFCFSEDGAHRERCALAHCKQAPAAPIVHMNGTGWSDLYEQYDAANAALRAAGDALRKASPNGRDYYVHPYERPRRGSGRGGTSRSQRGCAALLRGRRRFPGYSDAGKGGTVPVFTADVVSALTAEALALLRPCSKWSRDGSCS